VNRRALIAVAAVVTAVGCSGTTSGQSTADPPVTTAEAPTTAVAPASTASPPTADRCDADGATPIDADNRQGPEVVGDASDATVYGLMFTHRPPIRVGDEVKIVWRMTGQGDLAVRFVDPSGRERPLVFGPEPHGSSNYDRPGDEWGTGFLFDRVGCWQIHLERDVGIGDVWIDVVA
jgi:hypothetical protein